MAMNKEQQSSQSDGLEWFGMLIGPIAWLTQFLINYVLVRFECIHQNKIAVHVVHFTFLLLVIAGGIVSWVYWTKTRQEFSESEKMSARPHFMAMIGILSSILFSLAIIMQTIPGFLLNPCDR